MAIAGLDEDRFKKILRENLSPARAISNPEHLRGRQALLSKIDWAFNSPGRHVFIFGERGVGKTSLAQSAAHLHQSSDEEPVMVACDEFVPFNKLIADIARAALPPIDVIEQRTTARGVKFSGFGISAEMQDGLKRGVPKGGQNYSSGYFVPLKPDMMELFSSSPISLSI
ncbi:MAG: ATP-binding protein [Hyphomicrobiaceae bacterium]